MIYNEKSLIHCSSDAMRRTSQLALGIYARVPLIPQLLFMSGLDTQINSDGVSGYRSVSGTLTSGNHKAKVKFRSYSEYDIFVCYLPFSHHGLLLTSRKPLCQMAVVWGTLLAHENVLPLLGICEEMSSGEEMSFYFVTPHMEHGTLRQWRRNANLTGLEIRDHVSLIFFFFF
jgi:hypothetical protein